MHCLNRLFLSVIVGVELWPFLLSINLLILLTLTFLIFFTLTLRILLSLSFLSNRKFFFQRFDGLTKGGYFALQLK